SSTLGRNADIVIRLGMLKEAGHIGLAPSITTTAMLAVGDALADFVGITPDDLPLSVKVRVLDYYDDEVYQDSSVFNLDYYNVTWTIRDCLSGLLVTSNLSVNDTCGWNEGGVALPRTRKTPAGSCVATWKHNLYGDQGKSYLVEGDMNVSLCMESKIVHVWEAKTLFAYYPGNETRDDYLAFTSYLLRDGGMAGTMVNSTFFSLAQNCTVEVYYPNGTTVDTFYTDTISEKGFFNLNWSDTGLNTSVIYPSVTIIQTDPELSGGVGGVFRTPFSLDLTTVASIFNVTTLVTNRVDMPISAFQANMTLALQNQTNIIYNATNATVVAIESAARNMTGMINTTLNDFVNQTNASLVALERGAEQAIEAGERATDAAEDLEATAKKYSWAASVAPNPALVGDEITLSVQGPAGLLPIVNLYSWDNEVIVQDVYMTESATQAGLYTYSFYADARFDPGKSYTYVVTEQVSTYGMVTGSGVVESMSITTIAGLAAAAPEAERAAKKALDAIKAVEAVVVSSDNINIALTLKNLKDSVEALPEAIAKEGATGKINDALNELADRLKGLGLDEGYDFTEMLEKALGESPTLKEVRSKTDAINSVVNLLLQIFEAKFGGVDTPIVSTSLLPGSVRFRLAAVNPSKTRKQITQIKSYLPIEVKPRDIVDLGGLDLEYDAEKSIYYVYKPAIELQPTEVRVFEVEVNDVWVIPDQILNELRDHTETVLKRLEKTEYFAKGKEVADSIFQRLNAIPASQVDENVSRSQHIGIYRENLDTIAQIKEDIAKLEKILATAGGPLAPEMLTKTKIKAESPTKTMTWIVIFVIVMFVGLLAGVLFFTWHRQTRLAREELLAAKKASFPGPSQENESKEGNTDKK
ncbi:MAG: hypothetical protein KBA46_06000, partial [Candidatus Omnitrophica bacterium]|nr:hypothetical protein [Candidatus Omnitrophota bacterium]